MSNASIYLFVFTVLFGLGDMIAQFIVPEDSGKLNWKVIILINYSLELILLNIHERANKTYMKYCIVYMHLEFIISVITMVTMNDIYIYI